MPKGSSSGVPRRRENVRLQQGNSLLTPSWFQSLFLAAVGDGGVSPSCTPDVARLKVAWSLLDSRLTGTALLSAVLHYTHQINSLLPDFSMKELG